MGSKWRCVIGLLTAAILTGAGGCGASVQADAARGRLQTKPAQSKSADNAWAALPVPPDFDREKAALPLAQVPDDPPAPAEAGAEGEAELPRQALRHIEEARRLFFERRYSETIREAERALRYNAPSSEAHRLIGLAGLLSGDDEQARSAATRAVAIRPDDLPSHYVLGRLAKKSGDHKAALREYRLALKSEAGDAWTSYRVLTQYYLGNLLYENQYYTAAIEQLTAFEAGLDELGKRTADNPELATIARVHRGSAAIRVARAHGLLGNHARAADSLKVAITQSPGDKALRTEYIQTLARAGRLDEAAQEAARFVRETDGDPAAVELLMALHRHRGDPGRALEVIRTLAADQPDNVQLWNLYIDALSSARRFDEAVAALNELVSRHPDATDSRWRLIQLTRERGDWTRWLAALAQHLRSQPQDSARVESELAALPQDMAGKLVAEADRPANQRKLLPALADNDEEASALDVLLAHLAGQAGQSDRAEALLQRAAERTPRFLPAVIGLADRQVEACRWKEAIATVDAADLQTTSSRLEYLLGRAYDGLDRIEDARIHYMKARELNKADPEPLLRLGRLYERIGKAKEAQPHFQTAIVVAPENMRARELFVRHLLNQAAQGDRAANRAAVEIKDMERLAPQDPATIRMAALAKLVERGKDGRQEYVDTLKKLIQNVPDDAQSREDLTSTLLAFREYEAAREQAAELLRQEPCSAEAGELMATIQMRLLDFPAALRQAKQTLAFYPNRESLLVVQAQVALIQQDYDTAIAAYRHLLELDYAGERKATYQSALVGTLREARRFDEARQVIVGWLADAQDEAEVARLRNYLLAIDAAADDPARYVARVREWLKEDPDNMTLRLLLLGGETGTSGRVGLLGMGRYDEAILLSLRWLAEDASKQRDNQMNILHDLRLVSPLMSALHASGRHDEAIELARAQVAGAGSDEERSMGRHILRTAYMRARRLDDAITLTQELLAEAGQDSFGEHRLPASLLSQAGRHEEAVAQVNKLLENLERQREQIEDLQERQPDPRHRPAFEQAFEQLRQRKSLLLRTLSYIYQRMDQRDVAETRLREAYQLDPTEVGINNDLGYILADSGRNLDEAERMIRVAVAEQPRTAAFQDSLGWVLYKKGDLQGARTWLLRSSAMEDGQDPVVYDHLADVEWRLGRKEAAIGHWRKSIEIYERQARLGEGEVEPDVLDRVKAKLAAAESDGAPKVAPIPADTQPAG